MIYNLWTEQKPSHLAKEKPTNAEIKLTKKNYSKDRYETPLATLEFVLEIDNLKQKLMGKTVIDPFVSNGSTYDHLERKIRTDGRENEHSMLVYTKGKNLIINQ